MVIPFTMSLFLNHPVFKENLEADAWISCERDKVSLWSFRTDQEMLLL